MTHPAAEDGLVSFVLPMVIWFATLLAIVLIDVSGYLTAAARAQSLADGAALAAVSSDVPGTSTPGPLAEAERVALAGRGQLERCVCSSGAQRAEVTVSVAVPGLVVPTLGATRVAADATAVLAPPDLDASRGPPSGIELREHPTSR